MDQERRSINRTLMTGWTIIAVVLVLAYLLEVLKGARTMSYYVIFSAVCWIPLMITFVFWKKDPGWKYLPKMAIYSYLIFYVFELMTASTVLNFVYILPFLPLLILCNDFRISVVYSVVSVLANLLYAGKAVLAGMQSGQEVNLATYEIQVAAILLCCILMLISSRVSVRINEGKLKNLEEKEEKQRAILKELLGVSGRVHGSSEEMVASTSTLQEVSGHINLSMQQIAGEILETGRAIENQSRLTEEVAAAVTCTTEQNQEISDHIRRTREEAGEGLVGMQELSKSAEETGRESKKVIEEMTELQSSLEQARNILSLITQIASQTNLLALNASIEAARAGESGRGFAVVADEINQLSVQTKEATENIASVLNQLQTKAEQTSSVIERMAELSGHQNEIIYASSERFGSITENIEEVYSGIEKQSERITDLEQRNRQITENIQVIRRSSERVTADAQATLEQSQDAAKTVKYMTEVVEQLNREAELLAGFQEDR